MVVNRNVNEHFALNPTSLDIPRSQFDRSSGIKFSANVGELIPFFVDEVLPGDTFKITTSKVVRLQTLLHPIMDNMYMDTYWFFVPNRLVWDHWKNFMGESAAAWTPQVEYRIPKLNITTAYIPPDQPRPGSGMHPGPGSLCDYMGIPLNACSSTVWSEVGVTHNDPTRGFNALPFRAYAKICNDWFRAESLCDELVIPTDDNDVSVNYATSSDLYCAYGGPVFHAAKYHDYFTSCLPAPQSGPAVKIPGTLSPVGGTEKLIYTRDTDGVHYIGDVGGYAPKTLVLGSSSVSAGRYALNNTVGVLNNEGIVKQAASAVSGSGDTYPEFTNLWADLSIGLGTINDLRTAFQVQKFYEKMARGRRYIEVLKSQFGVTSPDARLQRSEYLGGNRIPINVSEVTNNSASDSATLGDLGAMSRTTDVHEDFVHSFTEHGYLFGLCVVRYDHSYPQGVDKHYLRTTMFDYYWPVFSHIGEQPVLNGQICFMSGSPGYDNPYEVFGYQEAWADYRFKPSRVAGEMRPEAPTSLASWHLGDFYDQSSGAPYLSDSWIREDKTPVDRCLAVTSEVSNQYFADFYVKNICTRVMPLYSIPGLVDHH